MAKLSSADLLDAFKEMTLLELSEFVKSFEETFDVKAAAPVAVAAPAGGHGGYRHRGGRLHVERLLELLDELGQLKEGHLLERLKQVVATHLRHVMCSSFLQIPSVWGSWLAFV